MPGAEPWYTTLILPSVQYIATIPSNRWSRPTWQVPQQLPPLGFDDVKHPPHPRPVQPADSAATSRVAAGSQTLKQTAYHSILC